MGPKTTSKKAGEGAEYSFTCFGKKGRDWSRKAGHDDSAKNIWGGGQQIRFQHCFHRPVKTGGWVSGR
jgi:hypothetical protein